MKVSSGERIGPYEIVALAGAGGMGEVYRARDSRINRDVAIKVLPESLAENPDRLRRFEQEARAAGMLNHPNLLTVYDVGTHDGSPYMVTEFLEGETLRDKLEAGRMLRPGESGAPIPARKAIEWAQQLSAGLAAAHDRGIVHRDLKPENIFVTRDGRVKILDFGLAKLLLETSGSDSTAVQTEQRGTDPGTVVGTAGYMSPEQIRAQAVDHRSDIFSLGAILYEMFAGRRAFHGDSPADTMSLILREDPPDLSGINRTVPPSVERIIRHCLEKNPEERFQSARDLSFGLASLSTDTAPAAAPREARRVRFPLVAAVAAAMLVAGVAVGWFAARAPRTGKPAAPQRTMLLTFSGRDYAPAVSPDRRTMVFSSARDGRRRLWMKELSGGGEMPITAGFDDLPRFSPDGSTILFIRTDEKGTPSLYRMAVVGGTPRRLLPRVTSADFTPDGKAIVFVPYVDTNASRSQVGVVSADGSNARVIASPSRFLGTPRCSPDGKWIALADQTMGNVGNPPWLVRIDGRESRPLPLPKGLGTAWGVTWTDAGHVIYGAPETIAGSITASLQRFLIVDIHSGEVTPVASGPAGTTIDIAGPDRFVFDAFLNRQNLREIALDGSAPPRWFSRGTSVDRQPVYSPDGQWIAFSSNRGGNLDIWGLNRRTGEVERLTDDPADEYDPAYTPDGHLLFSSARTGHFEIWIAESDGSGARQLTRDGIDAENATVTSDGKWVIYGTYHPDGPGIAKIPLSGGPATLIYRGMAQVPDVSPDGKWACFDSLDANQIAVVEIATRKVYPFVPVQVRTVAGAAVGRSRWSADGKRIVWVDRDDTGNWSLQEQDFVPGADTRSTRRTLAQVESPALIESFAFSRDGKYLVTSVSEESDAIFMTENVSLAR